MLRLLPLIESKVDYMLTSVEDMKASVGRIEGHVDRIGSRLDRIAGWFGRSGQPKAKERHE